MITKSKNFDDVIEALDDLGPRLQTYARRVVSAFVPFVHEEVDARLKPKLWWQKLFKASLKTGYVTTDQGDFFAVYGDQPSTLRHLDARRVLIYFGHTNNKQLALRADLFRKYEPWTVDTLPKVAADLYGAKAKIRVMAPAIVTRRRRELKRLLPKIMKELKAQRVPIKKGMPKIQNRAAFDLEHALLSQEFFRGGRPIWRPVLRHVDQLLAFSSAKVDAGMLLDPKTDDDVKTAMKGIPAMNPALLTSISEFQSKLIGKAVRE